MTMSALSDYSAVRFGCEGCIAAMDGTTFPLAFQHALQPWAYFDKRSITVQTQLPDHVRLGLLHHGRGFGLHRGHRETFLQATAPWHRRSNAIFLLVQYLLGVKGMLCTRFVICPYKRPNGTSEVHRNCNYELARLRSSPRTPSEFSTASGAV